MTVFAYLRVSTDNKGQTTDNQRQHIERSGFVVDEWYAEEGVSGSVKATERPVFASLLDKMQPNDTLMVTMIDRLGRSASDILSVVESFKERGISLRVLQFDGIDITSSMGKMILTCMAAMAELERNLLIERTRAGLERTKAKGTRLGAPLTIAPGILKEMVEKNSQGISLNKLEGEYNIPRNTIHRNIKKWGDDLEGYEKEWSARKEQYCLSA